MPYESNQNNNRQERRRLETRGYTLRNVNAVIPSAMKISFYDDMMRISFVPPLPEEKRVDNKMFDYSNEIITNISRKNCNLLYNLYHNEILPAIKECRQVFKSVEVGESKNHIGLSSGVSLGTDGKPHPCLMLIRGIDPNTKMSQDVILYEFEKAVVHTDYNPITGEDPKVEEVDNELDMFIRDLDSFRAAASKAYIHSARVVDESYKNMISNILKDTATKAGVDLTKYSWTGNNANGNRPGASSYGYGSIFGGGSNDDSRLPFDNGDTPTTTINSMDELEQYMNVQ